MPTYIAEITINNQKHKISIDTFGTGNIPIMISGHAEIYAKLLENSFKISGLLKEYTFFVPKSYWCEDAPLANLSNKTVASLKLEDLALHLEEIRLTLVAQGLLTSTHGKIAIYAHSFFSALAFHYAALFPKSVLFLELEGPPPYSTEEWGKEKRIFFKANASKKRQDALALEKIDPSSSAVDKESMREFKSFRDGYHRMTPTLWYDFERDYRGKVWGDKQLNMKMMQHFFQILLLDYDCRHIIDKVHCPVHISLGAHDTAVPLYLWTDNAAKGGVGFFDKKEDKQKRDYTVYPESGHWPAIEEPENYSKELDKFVDIHIRAKL